MKFLHKVLLGTFTLGSANVVYAYLLMPKRTKITVIKNSSRETPDKRRFNKNPMDDKMKLHNYSVCRLRQEKNKDGAKFCRDKWFK